MIQNEKTEAIIPARLADYLARANGYADTDIYRYIGNCFIRHIGNSHRCIIVGHRRDMRDVRNAINDLAHQVASRTVLTKSSSQKSSVCLARCL